MRTTPAQLILAASVMTLFGFAGVASRTCSIERSGLELLPDGASRTARVTLEASEALSSAPAFDARSFDAESFDARSFAPARRAASSDVIPSGGGPSERAAPLGLEAASRSMAP